MTPSSSKLFEGGKPESDEIYSVSRLNREARYLLEENFRSIWVEGEVSNLHKSSAGHLYFTLKEEDSEIDAVMFSGDRKKVNLEPEDGMALIVQGTLTVYEKRGRYQLRVRDLKEVGKGKLQKKFQQLKKRLMEEGLFDESHKKSIPGYPRTLGIITSPSGAAVKDIISTIEARFPAVTCYIFPVKVQGEEAGGQISESIRRANLLREKIGLELLIVSRGGGSLEDLWPFNEEEVARAIYDSDLPVVSGVGHEVDFTISDFVADVRVPTPTAAGKEVVPDQKEILNDVELYMDRISNTGISAVEDRKRKLDRLISSFGFRIPFRNLEDKSQEFDELAVELLENGANVLSQRRDSLNSLVDRLSNANPTELLKKGYSVTYGESGTLVTDCRDVEEGESLKTKLYKGIIRSVVTGVDEDE
ncbi:MAG: exodeoxyribonuclease VII large subunit [Candidatus Bipolaricaulota bacterium]|nr:exodeoxyribonuclease VII large subunit [Candidatus Bipolaricaulota bacterium]MBS3792734.1 exodeoxyribonuclease VII large subunit [Candidatus Bipolaricaulota bacterium]